MKPAQMILVLGLLVVVVFGATFVSMYVTTNDSEETNNPSDKPAEHAVTLTFDSVSTPKRPGDEPRESEFYENSAHFFWFENQNKVPVRVGLNERSCQCAGTILYLAPESMRAQLQEHGLTPTGKDAQAGFIPSLLSENLEEEIRQKLGQQLADQSKGQNLSEGDATGVEIPPGAFGAIRLGWTGKPEGGENSRAFTIRAVLWHKSKGEQRTALQVKTRLLNPVLIETASQPLGEMGANDERNVAIRCWSATRDQFGIRVEVSGESKQPESEKLVKVSHRPLTAPELDLIRAVHKTEARSGYLITAQARAHSESKKRRMPQGPFAHRIVVTALQEDNGSPIQVELPHQDPTDYKLSVLLTGDIQGDFDITDETGSRGAVNMKSFLVKNGAKRSARIRTQDPDKKYVVQLDKDRIPWFVRAELKPIKSEPDQPQQWELNVEIPRDQPGLGGAFPRHEQKYTDTSLYLLVESGGTQQQVRIPVKGIAQR